jgi:hypothetical protein
MDINQRAEVLRKEIEESIKFYKQKHTKSKKKAYAFKIMSVTFSAVVTVLLGLNIDSLNGLLKNIALVMGALATIISSVETFYDARSLWVKNTVTLLKLKELKRNVEFCLAGLEADSIDPCKLKKYMEELQHIIRSDLNEWLRIREKVRDKEEKNEEQILEIGQSITDKAVEEETGSK